MMSSFDAIVIARKYGLEEEIRQELASGLTPEQALEEWDISQFLQSSYILGSVYPNKRSNH